MGSLWVYVVSSVGQKQLMALSGLGWAGFVLLHMLGNLLIFQGGEAYNTYSHALISNPAILLFELVLVTLLLTHVFYGVKITLQNFSARKQDYQLSKTGLKEASWSSRTMAYQGVFILVFIVLHLIHFKFGPEYMIAYGETEAIRDLFRLVVEKFQSPFYVGFYILSVGILGFHLSHGLYSSLQSLGFYHNKYVAHIQKLSIIYGIIIGLGFSTTPVYIYFFL